MNKPLLEIQSEGNNPEKFEEFKKKIIDLVSAMKYEEDPHVIFISAKGHEVDESLAACCRGFMMEQGVRLIESATGARVSDVLALEGIPGKKRNQGPIMGKGGEA